MLQDHSVVKYTTEYFEANGPRLINQFGDWGVFINNEQIDGPFYSRQDALDAYAEHIREQAEAEQTFAGGIEWDDIPFEGEPMDAESNPLGLQAVA